MKAIVKSKPEVGLWLEEVPKPQCGDREVLIKIKQTSICGTDIHIYKWDEWSQKTIKTPLILGHEFIGEVVEVGKSVRGVEQGQRVSSEAHVVCGHCRNCRAGTRHLCINSLGLGVHAPGGFAEFVAVPGENVFPIPEGISDDEATVFDPLGNAVHTALSFDVTGEDVLVTGAGPIGLMASAIAKKIGARNVVITDLNDDRLKLAKSLGIEHAVNIKNQTLKDVMGRIGMSEGFDVGLEMSGSPSALTEMISNSKPGAKIALLGILPNDTQIPWDQVVFKGLFLKGIYGREMFETWYKMCALLEGGLDIKPLLTHRFPFAKFEEAFQTMASGSSGKVILDWS